MHCLVNKTLMRPPILILEFLQFRIQKTRNSNIEIRDVLKASAATMTKFTKLKLPAASCGESSDFQFPVFYGPYGQN
ncbi:MAG: hypothetical protein BA872_09760 [Desulfobacterales bacterium C00003060]|nr:MAG: hypothetical protein BA861_07610 [Desulfobacterales bacterium S3730MH5]OEU77969.1 MAG: hypothetical protein BA872_09760 [Desulfobacterales bacterium C00003060]OEU78356.1 MAG: hypothetical protein BA865_08380 [Desulfobacterales bacterium S5133MH4]